MRQSLKTSLVFSLCLFLIASVVVLLVKQIWAIVLVLFLVFLVNLRFILRQVQITKIKNEEKIQKAAAIAQQNVQFASEHYPIGIVVYENQKIIWHNQVVTEMLPINELEKHLKKEKEYTIEWQDKVFQVETYETTSFLIDISKEIALEKAQSARKSAIGIVSVDNFDEVTDGMDDKEVSYLNSFITTILSDWLENYHIYYKRLNAERYFFVATYQDIEAMMKDKFKVLDTVRNESATSQEIPLTLSIGIAYGNTSLETIGDDAQANLDTALVRGGDQVVLRESATNAKPFYYGGKSASTTKRTRVRSRAMSTALKNIILQSDQVFIMGHRFPDMDAIGSAFGAACLARFNQKKAYIILDNTQVIPDVERCLQEIQKYPELADQVIDPKDAAQLKTDRSVLLMVDYHKPSLSISPELYEQFDKIVVIDHHRRGEEFPTQPILTYIESGASSASELVTELIEYQSTRKMRLQKIEATLLLAGMEVDTKNFAVRTTARTFDTASYLRTCGADPSLVQYLLSSDLTSYLEMNRLIAKAEYVTEDIVIAAADEADTYDSVMAAKTADTLLSMVGINAAFVITKRSDGLIGISARSSGTINVQVIMEELGGGGHFTNAAVQLKSTVPEVKEQLLQLIHQKINEIYQKE